MGWNVAQWGPKEHPRFWSRESEEASSYESTQNFVKFYPMENCWVTLKLSNQEVTRSHLMSLFLIIFNISYKRMRLSFNLLLHSQCLGCFLTLNRHSISTCIMNEYIEFTRKSLFGAFCEMLRKTQMDFLANTIL